MDIRLYQPGTDRTACLAIYDSNYDASPETRAPFERFLDSSPAAFWVMDLGASNLAACGGFDAVAAQLAWGMVRKDLQRQGLGRFLLLYRLKELGKVPGLVSVRAVVPGVYARFYEKNGMKLAAARDGQAEFQMKLQVCTG